MNNLFLTIICVVSQFLSRLADLLFPRTLLGEWLSFLDDDAAFIRRAIKKMKWAELYHYYRNNSNSKGYVEHIVFQLAFRIGYRQYFDLLDQRLLQSWIIQLADISNQLAPKQWPNGWEQGFNEACRLDVDTQNDDIDSMELDLNEFMSLFK